VAFVHLFCARQATARLHQHGFSCAPTAVPRSWYAAVATAGRFIALVLAPGWRAKRRCGGPDGATKTGGTDDGSMPRGNTATGRGAKK